MVMVVEAVRPLKAVDEVAKVMAPVSVEPGIEMEETPLLMEEVATHSATPLLQESICPPVPAPKMVDVATHEGRPVVYELVRKLPVLVARVVRAVVPPLPNSSCPSLIEERPVPPLPTPRAVARVRAPALLIERTAGEEVP